MTAGLVIRSLGRPGDLGWVIGTHGVLYAAEHGFDRTFEAMVCRLLADLAQREDTGRETGWIAELDGRPVGCALCLEAGATTAQLRMLLVLPEARGRGVGRALVSRCQDFARSAGYRNLLLHTIDVLREAGQLYRRLGFTEIDRAPYRGFGADLVGITYRAGLDGTSPGTLPRPEG